MKKFKTIFMLVLAMILLITSSINVFLILVEVSQMELLI